MCMARISHTNGIMNESIDVMQGPSYCGMKRLQLHSFWKQPIAHDLNVARLRIAHSSLGWTHLVKKKQNKFIKRRLVKNYHIYAVAVLVHTWPLALPPPPSLSSLPSPLSPSPSPLPPPPPSSPPPFLVRASSSCEWTEGILDHHLSYFVSQLIRPSDHLTVRAAVQAGSNV